MEKEREQLMKCNIIFVLAFFLFWVSSSYAIFPFDGWSIGWNCDLGFICYPIIVFDAGATINGYNETIPNEYWTEINSSDGTIINGTMIDGTSINGTIVNGTMSNGTMVNGTLISGTTINGTAMAEGYPTNISVNDITIISYLDENFQTEGSKYKCFMNCTIYFTLENLKQTATNKVNVSLLLPQIAGVNAKEIYVFKEDEGWKLANKSITLPSKNSNKLTKIKAIFDAPFGSKGKFNITTTNEDSTTTTLDPEWDTTPDSNETNISYSGVENTTVEISVLNYSFINTTLTNDIVKIGNDNYFLDCDITECYVNLNLTLSYDINVSSSNRILGLVKQSTLQKTSFDNIEIYETQSVEVPNMIVVEKSYTYYTNQTNCINDTETNTTYNCTEAVGYYNSSEQNGTVFRDVLGWYSIGDEYSFNADETYQIRLKYIKTDPADSADLVPSIFGFQLDNFAWWNSSWGKCVTINITNAFPVNYSHKIALNSTYINYSSLKADGTDLRFLEGNCTTPTGSALSDWIEIWNTSGNSTVWVKTATANVAQIAMYYNNSAATDTTNGSGTFILFDDFEDNDVTDWTANPLGSGTFTADSAVKWAGTYSGKYVGSGGGTINGEYKTMSITSGVVETNVQRSTATNAVYIPAAWTTLDSSGTYFIMRDTGQFQYYDTSYHDIQAWSNATWYKTKLVIKNTSVYDIYINDALKVSNANVRSGATFTKLFFGVLSSGTTTNVDNIFLHLYQATEPTYAYGTEETAPSNNEPTVSATVITPTSVNGTELIYLSATCTDLDGGANISSCGFYNQTGDAGNGNVTGTLGTVSGNNRPCTANKTILKGLANYTAWCSDSINTTNSSTAAQATRADVAVGISTQLTQFNFTGTAQNPTIWMRKLITIDNTGTNAQNWNYANYVTSLPANIGGWKTCAGDTTNTSCTAINSSSSSWCYQETATTSTACGGLSNGTYAYDGIWDGTGIATNTYDANWNTYGVAGSGAVNVYMNYSKPISASSSSLWEIKYWANDINVTIPSACWALNPLQFKATDQTPTHQSNWYCYNGTGWTTLATSQSGSSSFWGYIIEEAMWWDTFNFQLNASAGQTNYTTLMYNYSAGAINFTQGAWTPVGTINESNQTFNATLSITENVAETILFGYNVTPTTLGGYAGSLNLNATGQNANAWASINASIWGDWIPAPTQNAYTQNTSGTKNYSRTDFNSTYVWTANSTMPATINMSYTLPTTPTLGGTCTGSTWITGTTGIANSFAAGATYTLNTKAYADCITEAAFSAFAVKGTPTEVSQIINKSSTWSSLWTGSLSTDWSTTNDSSTCWTAQVMSGTATVATGGTYIEANMTGDCVSQSADGAFTLIANSTEASQTIQSNRTVQNLDTDYSFSLASYTRSAEGTSCWTSGTQQLSSGAYVLASSILTQLFNQTGDCITDGSWTSFAVNGTPTESAQQINKSRTPTNGDSYAFNNVAWSTTNSSESCWTSQLISGNYNLPASGSITLNATMNGDCINESVFGAFAVYGTPTESAQTVQSNKTVGNLASAYTWTGVAWSKTAEGTSCWTSGTQQLSGSYTLGGTNLTISANQTGDCITDGSWTSFTVKGTPTESSQTINKTKTATNLDTYVFTGVTYSTTNDSSICWTSQTGMSGSYNLLASGTNTTEANMTGDCVYNPAFGSFFVYGTPTESSQTISKNRTVTNNDTDYTFNVAWSSTNDTSTCWVSNTSTAGTYNLATTIYQSINETGDCISEGTFGAFSVYGTPTESSQTIQSTKTSTNLDTDYTFNVAWSKTAEGSVCWTDVSQLSGTYNLATTINVKDNDTGDCIQEGSWTSWNQNVSAPINISYVQISKSRLINNLDTDFAFNSVVYSTTNHSANCWSSQTGISGNYNLVGASLTQYSTMIGDCITETSAPANITQNTTTQDYIRYGDAWLYLYGNVTALNLISDISLTGVVWNWTDSNIYTNFTGAVANFTFNVANSATAILTPYWRVNITVTNATTSSSFANGTSWRILNISDNPYSRSAAVRFAYTTGGLYEWLYKCTAGTCNPNTAGDWTLVSTTNVGGEMRRTGDSLSTLTYLVAYTDYNTSITYDTPVYETNASIFNSSINYSSNIQNITAWLNWTGTTYLATASTNGSTYNFNKTITPDLETTNNTVHAFKWVWQMNYTNGTLTNVTGASYNQYVIWAYYPVDYSITPIVLDIDTIYTNVTLVKAVNFANVSWVYALFNNTNYSMTNATSTFYQTNFTAPTITVGNQTFVSNATANITYGGTSKLRASNDNQTIIYHLSIFNCTNDTGLLLNYTAWDEDNSLQINYFDLSGKIIAYNPLVGKQKEFGFSYSNNSYYAFCIEPTNLAVNVYALLTYKAVSYPSRSSTLTYLNLTNNSADVNQKLWLLGESLGGYYNLLVYSASGSAIYNANITIASGTSNVSQAQTNPDGSTTFYLKMLNPYVVTITAEGYTDYTFNFVPGTISKLSIIMPGSYYDTNLYKYIDNFTYSCNSQNITGVISINCTITDPTSTIKYGKLIVQKINTTAHSVICNTTVAMPTNGTSLNISCSLGLNPQGSYEYTLYSSASPFSALIKKMISFLEAPLFSGTIPKDSAFYGLLMVLGLGFVGLFAPEIALVGGLLGLVVSGLMGLVSIGVGSIAVLGLAVVVIVYKMRV